MYKMSPKKVFDVLRTLVTENVISTATAKLIAATYAEYQIEPHKKRNGDDTPLTCPTCKQTILPF